jgi:hypothetical protein
MRTRGAAWGRRYGVEILAAKLAVEVVAQVVADEVLAADRKAVAPVEAAEGVVDRGVEGAGSHQGTQFGDRPGKVHLTGDFAGGLQILRFQRPVGVQRMAVLAIRAGEAGDLLGQPPHGFERGVVGNIGRGKRPDVAQRHGRIALGGLAVPAQQAAADSQQGYAIHLLAAELVGRAIAVVLVAGFHRFDARVGGKRRSKEGGHHQKLAPADGHNPAFARSPRSCPRSRRIAA